MTDDEMVFYEELHRVNAQACGLGDASLGLNFNPAREIDDILHEMATGEPNAMDWYTVYSIVQRARRWVARISSGEPTPASGWIPTRAVLRTGLDSTWRPLLDEMLACQDLKSMLPQLAVLENYARLVLRDQGLLLTAPGSRRVSRPPMRTYAGWVDS